MKFSKAKKIFRVVKDEYCSGNEGEGGEKGHEGTFWGDKVLYYDCDGFKTCMYAFVRSRQIVHLNW